MKKLGLITALLSAAMLTACVSGGSGKGGGGGGGTPGSKETHTKAIEAAKDFPLVAINGESTLYENDPMKIGRKSDHYNNDYLSLTTAQVVKITEGKKTYDLTVNLDWHFDESDSFIKEVVQINEYHKAIYFLYNENQEHDFPFSATLSCGKADPVEMPFKVTLATKDLKFVHYTMEEIYKPTDEDDNFALVDPVSGYYKPNNPDFLYTCVSTEGKVLYTAPDGNWALIGDGDYVLELWSGGALNLHTKRFPALEIGNTVYLEAELGVYYGNLQISHIFDISNATVQVKEPTGFRQMTGDDFRGKHYWQGGIMNTCRTVNAVYQGELKNKNGQKVSNPDDLPFNRFTFKVTVDDVDLTIAFDYHVDPSADDCPVFTAFKEKLKTLSVGSSVTLKGTVRFVGPTEKTYDSSNKNATSWSLVPYLVDHIA